MSARRHAARLLLLPLLTLATVSGCRASRDVVPESRDVTGVRGPAPDAYEYVTRRTLGVVALAEARNIDHAVAVQAVERVADHLQTCAAEQRSAHKLVKGALRVVAAVDHAGAVGGLNLKVERQESAPVAILCVVAPLRALTFPPDGDAGTRQRGIALEVTWEGDG